MRENKKRPGCAGRSIGILPALRLSAFVLQKADFFVFHEDSLKNFSSLFPSFPWLLATGFWLHWLRLRRAVSIPVLSYETSCGKTFPRQLVFSALIAASFHAVRGRRTFTKKSAV